MLIYFCGAPFAEADIMKRTWGTEMTLKQWVDVTQTTEIPVGNWGYVSQKQAPGDKAVPKSDWERMISGDFSQIADQLRAQIPGCEPTWIEVSWDSVRYDGLTQQYSVTGLTVLAMVKNNGAGMTGLEIIAILIIIAILAVVITLCLTGSWVVVKVMDATAAAGPWMTILIGLVILMGIGFLLYTLLGGKISYKGKTRKFSTSKGKGVLGYVIIGRF